MGSPTYAQEMRIILAAVLLIFLSGCSSDQKSGRAEPRKDPSASASAPAAPDRPEVSETKACSAVRAGINAFNAGDFSITVDEFRRALPLARAQAEDNPSKAADDLVEAITYYAELAPEDYPQSAVSSPEFLKYKAITLGQCVGDGAPLEGESESPGITT